jgi:DNA repair photolyase
MRRTISLLLVLTAVAVGCASTGPPVPPSQVTDAEAAVRSAENAGAASVAPEYLDRAQKALAAGRAAISRSENDEARRQLEEARAYALAAEARSNAERLKRQATELKAQADELESKAKQLQERARP